jgi:hypothetical protein
MDEQLDTLPAASVAWAKIDVTALADSDVVVIEFAPAVPDRPAAEIVAPHDESL